MLIFYRSVILAYCINQHTSVVYCDIYDDENSLERASRGRFVRQVSSNDTSTSDVEEAATSSPTVDDRGPDITKGNRQQNRYFFQDHTTEATTMKSWAQVRDNLFSVIGSRNAQIRKSTTTTEEEPMYDHYYSDTEGTEKAATRTSWFEDFLKHKTPLPAFEVRDSEESKERSPYGSVEDYGPISEKSWKDVHRNLLNMLTESTRYYKPIEESLSLQPGEGQETYQRVTPDSKPEWRSNNEKLAHKSGKPSVSFASDKESELTDEQKEKPQQQREYEQYRKLHRPDPTSLPPLSGRQREEFLSRMWQQYASENREQPGDTEYQDVHRNYDRSIKAVSYHPHSRLSEEDLAPLWSEYAAQTENGTLATAYYGSPPTTRAVSWKLYGLTDKPVITRDPTSDSYVQVDMDLLQVTKDRKIGLTGTQWRTTRPPYYNKGRQPGDVPPWKKKLSYNDSAVAASGSDRPAFDKKPQGIIPDWIREYAGKRYSSDDRKYERRDEPPKSEDGKSEYYSRYKSRYVSDSDNKWKDTDKYDTRDEEGDASVRPERPKYDEKPRPYYGDRSGENRGYPKNRYEPRGEDRGYAPRPREYYTAAYRSKYDGPRSYNPEPSRDKRFGYDDGPYKPKNQGPSSFDRFRKPPEGKEYGSSGGGGDRSYPPRENRFGGNQGAPYRPKYGGTGDSERRYTSRYGNDDRPPRKWEPSSDRRYGGEGKPAYKSGYPGREQDRGETQRWRAAPNLVRIPERFTPRGAVGGARGYTPGDRRYQGTYRPRYGGSDGGGGGYGSKWSGRSGESGKFSRNDYKPKFDPKKKWK